jgi:O-antigen/teichoic acid export membrane protein
MGNSIHGFFYVPFSQIWNTRRFVIEKEPDAKRIYAKVCTYFIGAMTFVGLGMSLFAKDIVKIISSREYWDAGLIIPLVVLSYVVYAMEDHLSTGIWLKKKTERISVVVLLSGAVNIGLNFVLIPYLGMYGAVLSTLLSFMVRNVGLYYLSNQLYPIPFEWGRLSFIFGISIILYLIGNSFQGLNLWVGVLTDLGLWICFPLVVYVFILNREEKEGVKNILGFVRENIRLHFFTALKARAKEYWG